MGSGAPRRARPQRAQPATRPFHQVSPSGRLRPVARRLAPFRCLRPGRGSERELRQKILGVFTKAHQAGQSGRGRCLHRRLQCKSHGLVACGLARGASWFPSEGKAPRASAHFGFEPIKPRRGGTGHFCPKRRNPCPTTPQNGRQVVCPTFPDHKKAASPMGAFARRMYVWSTRRENWST
jgi:hypothetical protein